MKLDILTNDELFKLAAHQDTYSEHINNEWVSRYGMAFPYKFIDGKVYNCILDLILTDEECDKLVAKHAETLRKHYNSKA